MTVTTTGALRARLVAATVAIVTLALALVAGPAGPATAAPQFRDVPPSHQFYDEITWLADMRVTTGFADGTFKPRDAVTREAFAAFLYRLVGSPQVTLPSRSPFADVPTGAKFYREIVWLSQEGITTGWADGTFRPREDISREAIAAFLYRLAGKPAHTAPSRSPFEDMDRSSKFYREVTWLADTGITTGYADHTFRPRWAVQRQAIAAFLYRGSSALHGGNDELYIVGEDVFPGTYVAQPLTPEGGWAECAWDRYAGDQVASEDRLFTYARPGQTIATIQASDGSFTYDHCTQWRPLRPSSPSATTFGDGTSAVGYHMRPGTYRAPGGPECEHRYWDGAIEHSTEIGWASNGQAQQLEMIEGRFVWSDSCGTWTRVGD